MTTSLAAMAHGRVGQAWRAQPFGVVLFVLVGAAALAGTAQIMVNRPLLNVLRPRIWWAAALIGGMLAGWGWKALAGHLSGRYPLG